MAQLAASAQPLQAATLATGPSADSSQEELVHKLVPLQVWGVASAMHIVLTPDRAKSSAPQAWLLQAECERVLYENPSSTGAMRRLLRRAGQIGAAVAVDRQAVRSGRFTEAEYLDIMAALAPARACKANLLPVAAAAEAARALGEHVRAEALLAALENVPCAVDHHDRVKGEQRADGADPTLAGTTPRRRSPTPIHEQAAVDARECTPPTGARAVATTAAALTAPSGPGARTAPDERDDSAQDRLTTKEQLRKLCAQLASKRVLCVGDSVAKGLGVFLQTNGFDDRHLCYENAVNGRTPNEMEASIKQLAHGDMRETGLIVLVSGKNSIRHNFPDALVAEDVLRRNLMPLLEGTGIDVPVVYVSPTRLDGIGKCDEIGRMMLHNEWLQQYKSAFAVVTRSNAGLGDGDFVDRAHLNASGNLKLLAAITRHVEALNATRAEQDALAREKKRTIDASEAPSGKVPRRAPAPTPASPMPPVVGPLSTTKLPDGYTVRHHNAPSRAYRTYHSPDGKRFESVAAALRYHANTKHTAAQSDRGGR